MDDILFEYLAYDFTFNQETDIPCPQCEDSYLSLDTIGQVYRCDNCGNTFVDSQEADNTPEVNQDD